MTYANDSSIEWQEVHSQDRTDGGNFLPDPVRVRIRDSCVCLGQLRGQGACGFGTHHIHWGLETDYSPLFVTLPHGMPCGLMNIQLRLLTNSEAWNFCMISLTPVIHKVMG